MKIARRVFSEAFYLRLSSIAPFVLFQVTPASPALFGWESSHSRPSHHDINGLAHSLKHILLNVWNRKLYQFGFVSCLIVCFDVDGSSLYVSAEQPNDKTGWSLATRTSSDDRSLYIQHFDHHVILHLNICLLANWLNHTQWNWPGCEDIISN